LDDDAGEMDQWALRTRMAHCRALPFIKNQWNASLISAPVIVEEYILGRRGVNHKGVRERDMP
jgi:hypothetical protein